MAEVLWNDLTPEQKTIQLYLNQKKTLDLFVERNAITREQYEKSLRELTEKMGISSRFQLLEKGLNMQYETIIDNMIIWAEEKLGNGKYAGWCLSFIEDALEISNDIEIFGGDCARESYEMYKDSAKTGVPERGAFVFYDCICLSEQGPVNWGHCGISLGNGKIIHAWDVVKENDYLDIEKLTSNAGEHPKYLGWVPVERVMAQKPEE